MVRLIELGVQIHMGNYFGRANQFLMLVPCIAIWLLAEAASRCGGNVARANVSGRLRPFPARVGGLLAALVVSGLLLPLFGASLVVLAALDRLVFWGQRRKPSAAFV